MKAFVEIAALGKTYDTPAGPAEIVRDFSLYVQEGEKKGQGRHRQESSSPGGW